MQSQAVPAAGSAVPAANATPAAAPAAAVTSTAGGVPASSSVALNTASASASQQQQTPVVASAISATPGACLHALVEEHMSTVLRDAFSVQRHAKRARLHPKPATPAAAGTHDAAAAANNSNNHRGFWTRRRLHAADVNLALQLRGAEPLYGTGVSVNAGSHTDDTIIDLNQFVRQSSTAATKPPSEVAASMHWLAVEGTVPEIPQNNTSGSGGAGKSAMVAGTKTTRGGSRNATAATAASTTNPLLVQQLQTAVLSEELQLYFGRVTMALENHERSKTRGGGGSNMGSERSVQVVLQSLSTDAGLQELVPFLIRYSQQALYQHVDHSLTVLQLILALLHNPNIHLELYVHELLPALMTCIVTTTTTSKNMGAQGHKKRKRAPLRRQEHWSIRQWASLALVTACRLFQDEYVTLVSRVLRTLCQALMPNKPLQSRYGGLVALAQFGPKAVDSFAIDILLQYWPQWQSQLLSQDKDKNATTEMTTSNSKTMDPQQQREALFMCQQAALEAFHVYFQGVTLTEQANRHASQADNMDWYDVLGDAVTPLVVMAEENQIAYATAFV